MPELPEVETVRRGLIPVMQDAVIEQAHVNRPDLRWPLPKNMAETLTGCRIISIRRRAKYLLLDLDRDETLIIHLGMSGRILISGTSIGGVYYDHEPVSKHDHVIFQMEDGARVTFNDPRRFGAMDIASTVLIDDHKFFRELGPEPLSNDFNPKYLVQKLNGRKTSMKSALLDQKIISGLGNIYVCEALFRAGVSPKKEAGKVSEKRLQKLVAVIRTVLEEAIDAGGSSLKDYRQTDGQLGYFQHNFKVYDREGQICVNPGCDRIIHRIVQSGRSTFHCLQCQR